MAEKTTLLQKIPPVDQQSSPNQPTQPGAGASGELQPQQELSISSFQVATYGSYILSFVLAGFAAVVLFRRGLGKIERDLATKSKALAGILAMVGLYGFFATFVYTNYLRDEAEAAPISLTVLVWTILGAVTGYFSNRFIELEDRPKKTDGLIDAIFYVGVFITVTLAVSAGMGANAALILSLFALILCIVPFSRFFTSCKRIKFNRRGSKRKPGRSVLYTLVSLPALLSFIAVLYVVELLGPELTIFLTNALSAALIVLISFAMLARIKSTGEASEAAGQTAGATVREPEMDPLVAELMAEEGKSRAKEKTAPQPQAGAANAAPPKRPSRTPPKPAPAKKQTQQSKAPKKPGPSKPGGDTPKSDADLKVKPPTKPKRRS